MGITIETKDKYYLVLEDILPEALRKTAQAKNSLALGVAKTIHEAVEQVGISRSAFYKYKDGIHPLNKFDYERMITISLDLTHRSGILSQVLALIASQKGNVLTIHQSIPLQGMANVVISVDTSLMSETIHFLLGILQKLEGVKQATIIGQG